MIEFVACVRLPDEPKGMFAYVPRKRFHVFGYHYSRAGCVSIAWLQSATWDLQRDLLWQRKSVQRKSVQCHGRVERPTKTTQRLSEIIRDVATFTKRFEAFRMLPKITRDITRIVWLFTVELDFHSWTTNSFDIKLRLGVSGCHSLSDKWTVCECLHILNINWAVAAQF